MYLPGVLENYSNVNKSGNVAQKSFSAGKIGARVSLDAPTTAVDPLCALCEPH